MSQRDQILDVVRRVQVMQTDILQQSKPCCLHIDTSFCTSLLGLRPKDDLYAVTVSFHYAGPMRFYQFGLGGDDDYEAISAGIEEIQQIINNL